MTTDSPMLPQPKPNGAEPSLSKDWENCSGCQRVMPLNQLTVQFYDGVKRLFCKPCMSYPSHYTDYDFEDEDEFDEDSYWDHHPVQCEVCGGEIGSSWSTCLCDVDELDYENPPESED